LDTTLGFRYLCKRHGKNLDSLKNVSITDTLKGIVTSSARSEKFPLPISSAAEQLYLSASSRGYGKEDDSGLVRLFTQSASAVHDQAIKDSPDHKLTPTVTPNEIDKIGFIGLGAMGLGMATSLVKAGFNVYGYDISPFPIAKFSRVGIKAAAANSPAEAALDAEVLILMVQNASQVEDVLFGSGKAVEKLPVGAIVILNSTVPPSFTHSLRRRLLDLGKELDLVDAPVSGGVTKAACGQLTVSVDNSLLFWNYFSRRITR
jgi:3-hydroxyisobutyrate dehydrogenase-like beta-hydroxyacid dehydrogenase